MSNYIQIPLVTDRPFASGALTTDPTWENVIGTIVAGNPVAAQDLVTVTGSGSGAIATLEAVGVALSDFTIDITTVGSGYEVGDTLSIAANTVGGGDTEWDEPLLYTIVLADLETDEIGNYQLVPAENVIAVAPDNSPGGPTIQTGSYDGAMKVYTLLCNGITADNYDTTAYRVSEAYREASQAENSQPVVEFPLGVSCYAVTYS